MITNKPSRLGDLEKFTITANGKNIYDSITELHVWQDILSPTWSAQVMISETSNMIHRFPLKQGTKFEISFRTKLKAQTDGEKKYNFVLYKISDRDLVKSRHQTYRLHLVDENFVKNQTKRIQKHFDNDPASIAASVIKEHLGAKVDMEKANNRVNIIIPNLSPLTCANWLTKMAVGKEGASFVFFMSDKGEYIFKSIYTLYGDKRYDSGITFLQRIANISDSPSGMTIPDDQIVSIQKYTFEHYDGLMNISNGFFGSQVCWYDFIAKKFDFKKDKFESDSGDFGFDVSKSNISFVPKSKKLFSVGPNMYDSAEQWHNTRKRNIMLLSQDRLFIQVPGGGKYWKFLGHHCKVELPSHEDMSGEKYDKYFRGKYLISAIEHVFKEEKYFVNLELIKLRYGQKMQ